MKIKFLLTTALSMCLTALWAQYEITEVRTQGSDNAFYDYIELKGEPGYQIPGASYIASIGNGATKGAVLTKVNISNLIFPEDGILTIGRTNNLSPDVEDLGINFNSFVNCSIIITNGGNPDYNGGNPYPASNVDVDGDGVIDVVYWETIVDGVAFIEEPANPNVPDYSAQLGIPAVANTSSIANIYWHISKDPITGAWTGERVNEGSALETFGTGNHSNVTASISLSANVTVSSLTIDEGAVLTVPAGITLQVLSDVVNNGGLVIESGASLVDADAMYTGNPITIKRNTQHAGDAARHNLVGSPVAGFSLASLGASSYFSYNEANDSWFAENSNMTMTAGQGYSAVGKTELVFTGIPNTGTVQVNATTESFKLLANPYPCAIQMSAFFSANDGSLDTEAIWLWNDGGSENGQRAQSDYVTVNFLGEAQTGSTGAKSSSNFINGSIGAMQGFFVQTSPSGSSISFTDAMKQSGNNADAAFFRKQEKHPQSLKISLSNNNYFSELLVGFTPEATSGIDPAFDAISLSGQSFLSIAASIENKEFSIVGFPKLDSDDVVIPLAVSIGESGNYSISTHDLKGIPESYNVLIHDMATGVASNLVDGYSFVSEAGQNTQRFTLILTTSATYNILSDYEILENVLVFGSSNGLIIETNERFNSASVFDLQGRLFITENSLDFQNGRANLDIQLTEGQIYIIVLDNKRSLKFRF